MYIFCAIRLYFIFGVIVKMAFIISVGSVINVVVLLLTSLPVRTHTHTRSFSHACGCVCVCVPTIYIFQLSSKNFTLCFVQV